MPAIQTNYLPTILPAYEGMIADSRDQTILSLIIESAGGVGFGKPVTQGAWDRSVVFPPAAVKYRGVTVATHFPSEKAGVQGTQDAYNQGDTIPVMVQGPLWVMASVAVGPDTGCYFVPTTGVFTNDATAPNVKIGVWETSTTGPGLAVVNLLQLG